MFQFLRYLLLRVAALIVIANAALYFLALFFGTILYKEKRLTACDPWPSTTFSVLLPGLRVGCETILSIHRLTARSP